ncbi:MAG: hypothetical protein EBU46_12205 [Nitrosomonadaceae bacterium]|nr:hypothetical protein [Nitrosomonadaceae bacterium]
MGEFRDEEKETPMKKLLAVAAIVAAFVITTLTANAQAGDGFKPATSMAASQAEKQAMQLEKSATNTNTPPAVAAIMTKEAQNLRNLATEIRKAQERQALDPAPSRYNGTTTVTQLDARQRQLAEAVVKAYDANGDGVLSREEQRDIPNYIWDELRRQGVWSLTVLPPKENLPKPTSK